MTKKEIKKLIIDSDYKNDSHRPVIRWSYDFKDNAGKWHSSTYETIWLNGKFQLYYSDLDDLVDRIFYDSNDATHRNFKLIVGGKK